MKKHLELLGFRVKDVVSGFIGVVTSISFDLSGCIQAVVSPGVNEKGELCEGKWFDTKRLVALEGTPVSALPTFEVIPGGQDLPRFTSKPTR